MPSMEVWYREIASRKHVEAISALTEQALREAGCSRKDIGVVAVTYAPGLIGAVLVGLSFAKSVAFGLGVPLIPVHHIRGHIAANYLAFPELTPPFLALAISGQHADCRCAGLHGHGDSGSHPGRCGGGVL